MFYLVAFSYKPNTAVSNRIMAYVKALSELRIPTKVVFFAPDNYFSKVEREYENINFEYYWEKNYINIKKLKKISFRWYLRKFKNRVQPGDIIYVYGFPELVVSLATNPDISVFAEKTEHPEVSMGNNITKVSINRYLEACRLISGIIVISQNLKQYFIEKGCQTNRVHIINMIVDSTRFEGLRKQPVEKYIAYCGTASNNKDGVDELIKAFAFVSQRYPNYKLYIIGDTPSNKQRFGNMELVSNLGLNDNVVFTGLVSYKEMPQILKNAEILALDRPNNVQAQYGFPTKLGEYLLTGNPVVITRVGDIPVFLKDKESALIAEPQNPQDFAEKMCWGIEHTEEATTIGQRGKLVAETSFNYLTETKKLVEIICSETKE